MSTVKLRRELDEPHYDYQAAGLKVARFKNDCTGYSDQKLFTQHEANEEVRELLENGYKIFFD